MTPISSEIATIQGYKISSGRINGGYSLQDQITEKYGGMAEEIRKICGTLNGKSVLDVGCDVKGELICTLKNKYQPESVVGINPRATPTFFSQGCSIMNADARLIPFPNETFDIIVSLAAFEHFNDLDKAFLEMYRVLKPNGLLYTKFGPIWSSAWGHHLWITHNGQVYNYKNTPLPPFCHLLMTSDEIANLCSFRFDQKLAQAITSYVTGSRDQNRMFFEDYERLVYKSPFEPLVFTASSNFPLPNDYHADNYDTLFSTLRRKFPGYSHFSLNSVQLFLKKRASKVACNQSTVHATDQRSERGIHSHFHKNIKNKIKKDICNEVNDNPLVTVITSVYNGAKYIKQCILSVVNQTYKNIEYIIIDACSNDGTVEIVKEHTDVIAQFISEPDSGIYEGMNKGLRLAKGKYIAILNSDDFFDTYAVENLVCKALKSNADIVAGHAVFLNSDDTFCRRGRSRWGADVYITCPLRHEAMLVSKEFYNKVGFYDQSKKVIADRLWMIKAFESNAKVAIYENDVVFFRQTGISSRERSRSLHSKEVCDHLFTLDQTLNHSDLIKLSDPWTLTLTDIEHYIATCQSDKLRIALQKHLSHTKSLKGGGDAKDFKVSIQLPVYNSSATLDACLESIMSQSYQKFEVVCVDDGSTDSSLEILQGAASTDNRFQIYEHVKNRGTLQARRTAFQKSRCDFMAFIDSDDVIFPTMIEELYKKASTDQLDFVQCLASVSDPNMILSPDLRQGYNDYFSKSICVTLAGDNVFKAFSSSIKSNLWLSFIHKSVYKAIIPYIDDGPLLHGNDNYLLFMLSYFARNFSTLNRILYCYCASKNSSNLNNLSLEIVKKQIESRTVSLSLCMRFIKKIGMIWDNSTLPFSAVENNYLTYCYRLIQRYAKIAPSSQEELISYFIKSFGSIAEKFLKKNAGPGMSINSKNEVEAVFCQCETTNYPSSFVSNLSSHFQLKLELTKVDNVYLCYNKYSSFVDHRAAMQGYNEKDVKNANLKLVQDLCVVDFITDGLPSGSKLLEIGGGFSRVLSFFQNIHECWCLDKFEGIGNGPRQLPPTHNYKIVQNYIGAYDANLPSQYFDLVFSISVVEHINVPEEDCLNIVKDIDRVLKPGGYNLHCIDCRFRPNSLADISQRKLAKFMINYYGYKEQYIYDHYKDPDVFIMSPLAYDRFWKKACGDRPHTLDGLPFNIYLLTQKSS